MLVCVALTTAPWTTAEEGPSRGRGALTDHVDVGVGQDGAVRVGGLALVHGRVVGLQVREADLPGGDHITGKWIFCRRLESPCEKHGT